MPPETLVTNHIHTDGPIPGPHSLLTLTATAHTADGVPTGVFHANLRALPGATLHPIALDEWRRRPEDWLTTRRAVRPPVAAMNAYAAWLASLPAVPVFVAPPAGPEYLFLYWYLQRFTGEWPFVGLRPGPARHGAGRPALCGLVGCRAPRPTPPVALALTG